VRTSFLQEKEKAGTFAQVYRRVQASVSGENQSVLCRSTRGEKMKDGKGPSCVQKEREGEGPLHREERKERGPFNTYKPDARKCCEKKKDYTNLPPAGGRERKGGRYIRRKASISFCLKYGERDEKVTTLLLRGRRKLRPPVFAPEKKGEALRILPVCEGRKKKT